MKILYGVQGTGNGHISRANAMAEALALYPDIEVTWLLSGREKALGCGSIENFLWREGMTFAVKDGKVQQLATLKKIDFIKFRHDVNSLDLYPYDLLFSDYEPVISHAAKKQGIPVIGIGHQYAFNYDIPKRGANFIAKTVMRNFAPVDKPVGLHWDHFGFPILPPILDIEIPPVLPELIPNKVIVYLPFENIRLIIDMLRTITDFEFYIYHPEIQDEDYGNIHTRAISRLGFKQDLLNARNVICNSGFELISECLQLGKCILSKPMQGQMEQLSNAKALETLNYASVIDSLNKTEVSQWLKQEKETVQINYPNVAKALAKWISGSCKETAEELSHSLWQ